MYSMKTKKLAEFSDYEQRNNSRHQLLGPSSSDNSDDSSLASIKDNKTK